jgi:membrane protease YdiL (CAAX protease family)
MLAWAASFAAVGLLGVPLALQALGVSPTGGLSALAPGDKAVVLLANQVVETVVGVAIIRGALRPYEPLPADVLRFDTARPFARRDGWLTWAIIGLLAAPLAIAGAAALGEALGYGEATAGGRGTADGVAGLLDMDSATFASLLVVTAVLAPILEETVFRGFLLPSLTRWVPTPVAVVLSALAFATAHLSARDFPQLFAFGLVLGTCYTRSRNLATPMLMHGAWNGTVLVVLYYLATHGVKVQELVRAGV